MTESKQPSLNAGALLGIHAQTSLHPGTGTALGTVDLPVQRERHTHWPCVAGSALKGVLRDAYRNKVAHSADLANLDRWDDKEGSDRIERSGKPRQQADNTLDVAELFGPPTAGSSEFAGALSVTDARLLAYPVRSLRGVFAWVTCPAVLERLQRDVALAKLTLPPLGSLDIPSDQAMVPDGCPCLMGKEHFLVLEEFEFKKSSKFLDAGLLQWLAENLLPASEVYKRTRERFQKQLVVLSNDDFTHFVRFATEVAARVGLDYETKTVKDGALFYQEFLPAESLFYSVVLASPSRSRRNGDPATLLKRLQEHLPEVLQIGGDETTGKGFCGIHFSTGGNA
jgi:CRISPR-associated protein Cmr4